MGLLTLIQIPCHHVLANEIDINLKYRIGLKHFFNINFGIGIIKKPIFCLYFRHISSCFYSNFNRESSLDVEFNSTSTSNECQLIIILMDLTTLKMRNTWKMEWWHHHSIFSGISCFWGSRVRQKYAKWVLVGCRIYELSWLKFE